MKRYLGLTAALASTLLAGCISFGSEPPDRLYTLTPSVSAPTGQATEVAAETMLSVLTPAVPQRLNVTRVPVTIDDSSLAYLENAVWVEKPARLFARLLAEHVRADGTRTVVNGGELDFVTPMQLSGQLDELGYDASSSDVVVRYDAVLRMPGGEVRMQRFESRVSGVLPEAEFVGPALNDAANEVAAQVAAWVASI